jgi:sugar O-acyltransferase (sialic acid O-acetyltransferase NeuD family)
VSSQLVKKLAVYGAGGHGQVIADSAKCQNCFDEIKLFDEKLGPDGNLEALLQLDPSQWNVVLGIGDNAARLKLAQSISRAGFSFATIIHPSSVIAEDVTFGEGTVLMAGVIINCGSKIGQHCILNTGSQIDHHGAIADGVHIGPATALAGTVTVGRLSFLGTGSNVIPNIVIGSDVMVAAGATVVSNIPDASTVKGTPAK